MAQVTKTEFDIVDWVRAITVLAVMVAGWVWLGVELSNHLQSQAKTVSSIFLLAPFLALLSMYAVKDLLIISASKNNAVNHSEDVSSAFQELID